ncbi:DUF6498-containing protein [Halovivax limisalsi]|uniref:DUF6498-containing protein n=1 Tax=Halovivax limisalsi TaxID=1453760 RepID=UPI001FFCC223|nr:DUF6498-containing protein [Halovivax limisalsi]
MEIVHWVGDDERRVEVSAAVVANLVPLVGVLAFGWRAATLVAVYWFELAVVGFWGLVRALFAGQPSEFDRNGLVVGVLADRSAALSLPWTGVGIQLSTLPVLVVLGPMVAAIWFVTGAVTVGPLGDRALDPSAITTVTYAIMAMFSIEGGRTGLEYFYRGGYREHSAQTAIQPIFLRCCVLLFVGMGTSVFAATADPTVARGESLSAVDPSIAGSALVVSIVLVKLGIDLVSVYRDRLATWGESHGLGHVTGAESSAGNEDDADDEITAIETVPRTDIRVRPPIRARLLATAAHLRRFPGAWFIGVLLGLGALLFATGRAWTIVAGLAVLSVFVPLLLLHLDYWLRYGGVEYRVDDDSVLAYDRLFDDPLWRVAAWDERDVRVERDRLDRLFGTETVVIELADRELRLPGLRDATPILDVFAHRRPAQEAASATT